MITIYCGECGVRIRVPAMDAGRTIRCMECDARIPVPRSPFARPQIRFFCPACGGRVRAWPDQAGESMRCPGCEAEMDLPDLVDSVESPAAHDDEREGDDSPAVPPESQEDQKEEFEEEGEEKEEEKEEEDVGETEEEIFEEEEDEKAEDEEEQEEEQEEEKKEEQEKEKEEEKEEEEEEEKEKEEEEQEEEKPARVKRPMLWIVCAVLSSLVILLPLGLILSLRLARPDWLDHKLVGAAKEGNYTSAKMLLLCGADANAKDNEGRTPLLLAVAAGNKDMVELLVNKGADVNFIRPADGRRLPDIAEEGGHHEIAELLLQKKRETEEIGRLSYTICIPSEESPESTKSSTASRYAIPPGVKAKERPLKPVAFFTTYLMKIGIRRLCPARGGGAQKFLVVVFSGPLDLFNVTKVDPVAVKENDPNAESFNLTRKYDPKRFSLILSNGTASPATAMSPHWKPVEDSPTSNIFYFDLTKRYDSEADLRKGNLAVAWLVESQDCKPPFKVQIDGNEPMPVPNRRFDSADDP